jgi:hypothetical protein
VDAVGEKWTLPPSGARHADGGGKTNAIVTGETGARRGWCRAVDGRTSLESRVGGAMPPRLRAVRSGSDDWRPRPAVGPRSRLQPTARDQCYHTQKRRLCNLSARRSQGAPHTEGIDRRCPGHGEVAGPRPCSRHKGVARICGARNRSSMPPPRRRPPLGAAMVAKGRSGEEFASWSCGALY